MFGKIGIVAALLLLASPGAFSAQTGYSGVIEDLPLMPGMVERTEEALVFDTPGGRIVETGADIGASAAEVETFYGRALPPLGWTAVSPSVFTREDETLRLHVEKRGGAALVRFNLNPAPGGQ